MTGVMLSFGASFARVLSTCATSVRRTFADHVPLYICAIVFVTTTIVTVNVFHLTLELDTSLSFLNYITECFLLAMPIAAMARLVQLYREGADRPFSAIADWFRDALVSHERLGNMFHSVFTFTPLMISFASLKDQIPRIRPFSWDATFMQWDRMLGFGRLPWEWLQPALGLPLITTIINFNYDLWFVLMFGCLFWQAFAAKSSPLRLQFLLAFAFAWFVGGNVLAVIFSSAGPCFYGHLFAHDPYAAQMEYLRTTSVHWPVWSVGVQDLLWQAYVSGSGAVKGISAMPSMHVIMAVLMAILGWRTNKWAGVAFTLFAFLIVIGSVMLAWHYAVDAIAGIALGFVFWQMAGAAAQAALKISARSAAA